MINYVMSFFLRPAARQEIVYTYTGINIIFKILAKIVTYGSFADMWRYRPWPNVSSLYIALAYWGSSCSRFAK